jgi:hypothetical protein
MVRHKKMTINVSMPSCFGGSVAGALSVQNLLKHSSLLRTGWADWCRGGRFRSRLSARCGRRVGESIDAEHFDRSVDRTLKNDNAFEKTDSAKQ